MSGLIALNVLNLVFPSGAVLKPLIFYLLFGLVIAPYKIAYKFLLIHLPAPPNLPTTPVIGSLKLLIGSAVLSTLYAIKIGAVFLSIHKSNWLRWEHLKSDKPFLTFKPLLWHYAFIFYMKDVALVENHQWIRAVC